MKLLNIALSLLFCVHVSAAESHSTQVIRDFSSPVTTPANKVFWSGVALTATAAVFRNQISEPLQSDVTRSRPLGGFASNMGKAEQALQPNIAYAAGMFLEAWARHDSIARDRGNLMFRATTYAQLMTTAVKFSINEPRPGGVNDKRSFPSGHTTGAFSFASVVAAEHAWYWGALAYTYASLVAYGRMNDNRHFLHDVLGGATIGASYGWGLYYRAHHTGSKDTGNSSVMLLPAEDLNGATLALMYGF